MRVVSQGSKVWRQSGVGSGDVAAVLNCAADNQTVLELWAKLVSKRELKGQKVKKVTLEQGSEEWLKWRNAGLGGSEVGCVMGSNPYRDSKADRVWGRKLPSDHPNFVPEVKSNPAMQLGHEREPGAREMYEALFGWPSQPLCVIHDDYDCVRCSLDGIRDDHKVNLEIKCSGVRNHLEYLRIGQIADPFERQSAYSYKFPYYRYQILYQLLITKADVCHFVGWNPTMDDPAERFVVFDLYPEPKEMDRLLQRVLEFWAFVEGAKAPPAEWLVPCWRHPDIDDLAVTSST